MTSLELGVLANSRLVKASLRVPRAETWLRYGSFLQVWPRRGSPSS